MKKTAIITGGSRGIGFAISLRFAAEGFNVVLAGTRDENSCRENLDILDLSIDKSGAKNGASWLYVQADVSTVQGRQKIIDAAVNRFSRIDVLVNNAGVAPKVRADLLEMTEESWDYVIDTNTKSNMFLTQLAVKVMLKQDLCGKKRGTIINISSCSAEVSSVNRGEYCVSKAGISMLTKLYADRLAGEGIFVHEIRPGVIKTDMTAAVSGKYDRLIGEGIFPIARWGTPEDVAEAAAAFAGDSFLYTTGNVVDVDGGFHIRRL
ncbi:MAG: 3-ketoacyl-ACP reductase [Treponema sp.]|nr:3-ketoacyl-ACP reductase [Treponema sp.]